MKQTFVAAAVAASLAMPLVAGAEATISGSVHMSVDMTDNGSNAAGSTSNHTSVSSNNSSLNFSGEEALGNGLQAVWRVDNLIHLDEGGGHWSTINTYLGLSGSFGTVLAGQYDTPYFAFQTRFDVFDATLADLGTIMGNTSVAGNSICRSLMCGSPEALNGFQLTTPNTLAYLSPEINGLQFAASYSTDTQDYGSEDNNDWDAYSASLSYSRGGLLLGAAYERHNYASPMYMGTGYATPFDPKSDTGLSLGASYTLNATGVGLLYETLQGNGFMDREAWTAYLTQGFGNNTAKLLYATVNAANTSAANDGASMWAVGLYHDLSVHTSVYGMYAALNNQADSQRALGGIDHGDVLSNAGGQDQTGFSLGMIHSF